MSLPDMDEISRRRPLCYDPVHKKFIRYDDIMSGKEKIIPVDSLSNDDFKKLVVERWRVLPHDIPKVQAISGPPLSRDEVIRAIEQDEPFGRMTVEGDKSYLRDLLDEIQRELE